MQSKLQSERVCNLVSVACNVLFISLLYLHTCVYMAAYLLAEFNACKYTSEFPTHVCHMQEKHLLMDIRCLDLNQSSR